MASIFRFRFAPSPTGFLHVGGARTALFNYLLAKKMDGEFVLRIEDTDKQRNTPEAINAITEGLKFIGVQWDGEIIFQSERNEIYEKYLDKLKKGSHVYLQAEAWRFKTQREKVKFTDLIKGKIEVDLSDETTNPDLTLRRKNGDWTFHFVNVVDDIEMKISH